MCLAALLGTLFACAENPTTQGDGATVDLPKTEEKQEKSLGAIVLSSEHYDVSVAMLSYYFHTNHQAFVKEHIAILPSLSLDLSKSLKDQSFGKGDSQDELFLGEFEGTWFDYFMDGTLDSVSNLLRYCEVAHEYGVSLGEDELAELDENFDSLVAKASTFGMTEEAYLASLYGDGVKEADVRRAMEYSELANKGMSVLVQRLSDSIGDEEIRAKYEENPDEFEYNTERTRNVAYMLFGTENAAENAIALLKSRNVVTAEAFSALAEELEAAHTYLEDYIKGSLASEVFDAWLFDENLIAESITEVPLAIDSSTFCVVLYCGEGHESWYVTVKNAILNEKYDQTYQSLSSSHKIFIQEDLSKRVPA